MAVNSVSGATKVDAYDAYGRKSSAKKDERTKDEKTTESGVVYEKSVATTGKGAYSVTKMSEEDRAALVQQLKDEQATRQQQFMEMVQKMMGQQANTAGLANLFSPENLKNVDPETIAQAKADVAEDGYYGVKQTSQRLFDFASALAGDDVEKMKKMEAAMEKGFKLAEKAWGSELPQISKDTISAARQLFADYYASKEAQ